MSVEQQAICEVGLPLPCPLDDIENSWEPIKKLHEDIRIKLQHYMDELADDDLSAYKATLTPGINIKPKSSTTPSIALSRPQTKKTRGSGTARGNKTRQRNYG
ncbi:unnamed protein product [Phytophthora fragariaefolia]|uniref:Unnamed protein product n=1 Tax=Phytophthora fragariaefolia TaxID=1490495 RepID=A0A9W6YD14_9STRA|nr:unnamed protein product [Phytophthora fragariaefolia]